MYFIQLASSASDSVCAAKTFLPLEFHELLYVGHRLNAAGYLVNTGMSYCCAKQIPKYSFST